MHCTLLGHDSTTLRFTVASDHILEHVRINPNVIMHIQQLTDQCKSEPSWKELLLTCSSDGQINMHATEITFTKE